MAPIALLLIVWMNWNHNLVLGVKVILTLLSTKPNLFSVSVFIKQLQQQYRGRHPILHKEVPLSLLEDEFFSVFAVTLIFQYSCKIRIRITECKIFRQLSGTLIGPTFL
ncbi:hypothetical protein Hanom_Chr06g00526991 [Helianthus anomalus]